MIRADTAYGSIADALRRQIARGDFAAGARMPTETQLCTAFGTSRITVRRAMAILEDERLIRRRAGSGTFVNPRSSRRISLLNTDYSGSIRRQAPRMQRRLESVVRRSATAAEASLLQLSKGGRVLHAVRVDHLDDRPVAYDEVCIPESMADGLTEEEVGRVYFLERWQKVSGVVLSRVGQSVEAVAARPPQVRRLSVRRGTPLLKETSTYFQAGRAAGVFITYYRHDVFCVVSTGSLPYADSHASYARKAPS